jgi:3-phosphoglycerate kinase
MGLTFLKAIGFETGASPIEITLLEEARAFLQRAQEQKVSVYLPIDLVVADQFRNDATYKIITLPKTVPAGWIGMDIGPKTVETWGQQLQKASTIFWNGPLGVFEFPHFARGTAGIAASVASSTALAVLGGGDSVAAVKSMGLEGKFTHISTGGGASLEFLEKGHLPGIDSLSDK